MAVHQQNLIDMLPTKNSQFADFLHFRRHLFEEYVNMFHNTGMERSGFFKE